MSTARSPAPSGSNLTLRLGEFAWTQLREEAARQNATEEDVAVFAILYYLADVDSGRVARQLPHAARGDDPAR